VVSAAVHCQYYEREDDRHTFIRRLRVYTDKCGCCDEQVVYFSVLDATGRESDISFDPTTARELAVAMLEAAKDAGGLQ